MMVGNTLGLFVIQAIACILLVGILAELIRIRQHLEDSNKKK
jgi:hypothetical protein